jgi:SP family myo-inositol transporter-like MFS transporter 13
VAASAIAMYFSYRVDLVAKLGDAAKLLAFKDVAWRSIFWVSLPPGLLFVIGSFMVAESPRWLYRRGQKDTARIALLRSRTGEQADVELREMEEALAAEKATSSVGRKIKESLLKRKYVIPFLLACIILACNQATGINSIIGFNTNILIQGGLSDVAAHWGSLIFTLVNFLFTIIAVVLVDKKGRTFLLTLGTSGIIISLVAAGILFKQTEKLRIDCAATAQKIVNADQKLKLGYNNAVAKGLTSAGKGGVISESPTSLILIYSYGDFRAATRVVRSNDKTAKPVEITRESCVPANRVIAFFSNPFADLDAARRAPLKIENAFVTPIPSVKSGWALAVCLYLFMSFFAIGPGVCVWLALSELMPTRIRSNGMSIALLINQAVSTGIAAFFLPTVGKYGYSTMFFAFAGCTVIYFITAAFFLPETKGKTLEEVEELFSRSK